MAADFSFSAGRTRKPGQREGSVRLVNDKAPADAAEYMPDFIMHHPIEVFVGLAVLKFAGDAARQGAPPPVALAAGTYRRCLLVFFRCCAHTLLIQLLAPTPT